MAVRPGSRPIADLWAWQTSAACRGLDSSWFYSPSGERGLARKQRDERARALCRGCPVREECARVALATGERYGVWGGMNAREREELLARAPEGDDGRGRP